MISEPVVTRFAPSPTGQMHLGNARTALFNALLARGAADGRFLLRMEDTDALRSDPAHAAQLAAGKPPRYSGRCRELSAAEVAARRESGQDATLRFRVPDTGAVVFDDMVHGRREFACADIGDFVLRRTDGSAAFFLSNAVDDALAGVTHALRGAGWRPEAIVNHLFRLGHSTPLEGLANLATLARAFDTAHLQRSPAHFDTAQLFGWQRLAVHRLSGEEAEAWLGYRLPAALFKPLRAALTGRLDGPELATLLRAMPEGLPERRLARFA